MTITKLKAKNQLTIPSAIIKRLNLGPDDLFAIDIEKNYIKLIPVKFEPKYTSEEIKVIDKIVANEKAKAKTVKPGKEFTDYLKSI